MTSPGLPYVTHPPTRPPTHIPLPTCAVAPAGVQLCEQRGALGAAAGGAQLIAQLGELGESGEPQVGNRGSLPSVHPRSIGGGMREIGTRDRQAWTPFVTRLGGVSKISKSVPSK